MIGQTVSHYKILEKLGEGGMGVVYKAHDTKLDRIVALKFLPHHLTANEAEKVRFLQEAKAAATLNHPHACTIYRIDEHENQQFIEMEYVDGETLRRKVPVAKIDQVLGYAVQIGEALLEAHAKGIVHRDIKCENIMVNSKNQIKVMDFGLAKLKGSLKLTRTSSTVGTLAYMAPEQIQGAEVDARSDIFSFGVVLFEMFTGHMPFRGEHEAAMMYSILNEEPELVTKHRQDASAEMDRIIHRALEKDPADRYQHVDDMVSELRRLQKKSTRLVRPEVPEQSQDFQMEQTTAPPAMKSKMKLWIGLGATGVIAAIVWFLLVDRPNQKITSMAVLPFVNAGADPSMEYLSDGFTEGLINGLSKLPGVKMMSRSSVFRYKGKDIDPKEVGKDLKVGAVLMGRITQSGDALSVSVELVNTRDNSHIWGEQYERKTSALIMLQSEISHELSRQLSITLTGDQEKQFSKSATENSEAYQLYLKGRFNWNKRTGEGFGRAVLYFQQAIDKDPSFARAYAGLADVYALMGSYNIITPKESIAKSRAAATRALELDEHLVEAHTTLAVLYDNYEWNWEKAEREYRRALELDPNYATAHQWYSEFLTAMGKYEDGLAEIRKATELDPLAPVLYSTMSYSLMPLRRYEEGIQQLKKALELDPSFPRAHSQLGILYFLTQRYDDAIMETQIALHNSDSSVEYFAALGFYYARVGKHDRAKEVLTALMYQSKVKYVPPFLIGQVYAGLDMKDGAFLWFNRAIDEHSNSMEYLKVDPTFDPIRSDPRFAELMKRVGLPR